MNPVEAIEQERRRDLVRDIRRELRVGTQMKLLAIIAVLAVAAAVAFSGLDTTEAVLGLMLLLVGAIRPWQRARLLKRAADSLAKSGVN